MLGAAEVPVINTGCLLFVLPELADLRWVLRRRLALALRRRGLVLLLCRSEPLVVVLCFCICICIPPG